MIYYKNHNSQDEHYNNIFGEEFVEKKKDNITLIINGNQNKLVSKYNLNEGEIAFK